jgi:osmotically-inducible protein OsmY
MREPLTALPADTPEQTGIEAPPGSEIWAEARLITTYSLNEHLNPFDITVDVEDDTVTLSGKMDSPVERDLAVSLARDLIGIDNVVDRLQIAPPGAAAPGANPLYRSVGEANTSARVKLQLLWREPVDGLGVDVTTSGDHVVLAGAVRSEETRMLAERVARRTTGVAAVDNQLTVDPDAPMAKQVGAVTNSAHEGLPDAWLTARVLASLRFDRTVDAERIDVKTQGGVVTLSGQVPTPADKREAAAVASAIDGVGQVQNLLGVGETGS